jgi:predicted nucleotidyltransferase
MANEQTERLTELLRDALGSDLVSVYLYGSAVAGGLKPASDLDLFVITNRRTSPAKRRRLIAGLRPLSARDARPSTWRPVELTVVALRDIVPWRYPPRLDFQSGEWLRGRFDAGDAKPWLSPNPDLAVVIAQVQLTGRPLVGAPPSELLPEIPSTDLRRAMTDEIGSLMDDLETDTSNVLLTLARIWLTLETGAFAAKDAAADWALARLQPKDRAALEQARDEYLGLVPGSWQEQEAWAAGLPAAKSAAGQLLERIKRIPGVATVRER